jgi:GUN4-like/Caspase domain
VAAMAKIALLIGVSEYGKGIPPLSSALNDVEAMERVLQNPNLGGFEQVERLLNPDAIAMRKAIQKLFREATKDDLVLLFFSGHGILNDEDHLYLATRNTAKDDFEATAVDASFIQGQSYNCYAKRQVLILDACYSGAYAQGWREKSVGVDIRKQLGAEGRVVLTSSSATQTSFEQEGSTLSLYTQYLVEGIETGAADTDNDGNIHAQELHAYAKAKVQVVKPKMTPEIILDKEGFNILLAYAPRNPEAEYRKLVEQYAQNGELNEFAFLVLKPKRKTLGLTDAKAEEIETEVLEPFRRRFANLASYKQAFAKAIEQKYPLDEHILKILKDYQEDILGLRDEDVELIELEITSVKEAEYQKQVQIQKQREAERLQLQRQREQENDDLSSEKGVNYRRLRDLLKAEEWKEANKETLAVMLKVSGRQEEGWLSSGSIENFPCTDLRTIDQLWVKYSNGRFGFSVQKRIWESVGKDYNKFGDRIGWRRKTTVLKNKWLGFKQEAVDKITWLDYKDLTFSTQSPEGHLPVPMRTLSPLLGEVIESKRLFFCGGQLLFFTLLSRLDL